MNNPQAWSELTKTANPAAGSNLTYLIDSRAYRIIRTISATFVADATVASRFPVVRYLDGDSELLAEFLNPATVVASETYTLSWAILGDHVQTSGLTKTVGALPLLMLPPGYRIQVTATNIQAGDQFSDINIYSEFHPSGNYGIPTGARPYEVS